MLSKSLRRLLREIVPKVDDLYAAIYAGDVPQLNKTNSAQDIKVLENMSFLHPMN